jgi:predicted dehydrogenase
MKRIKVGVVGVGYLGEHHTRIYGTLPNAELVGVSDTNEKRGAEIAEKYNTKYFHNFEQLLDRVDAVSIAVPTKYHFNIAQVALQKNTHLLVEKPIAKSVEEAEEIVRLSQGKKLSLHVGHIEWFNPALLTIKDKIQTPLFIESHRLHQFNPRGTDVAVVLDLMIHDLDIVLHFVRSPIRRIDALGVPVLTDTEDLANARIEFENGTVANLNASRVSRENQRKIRFYQKNTYITVDTLNRKVEIYRKNNGKEGPVIVRSDPPISKEEPLALELKSFLLSIEGGTSDLTTGKEGLFVLETAHKILKMIREREIPRSATGDRAIRKKSKTRNDRIHA